MARTGDFTYTNKTASSYKSIALYDMGERENYKSNGGDGIRTYRNTRASDPDAPEQFTITSANKKKINTTLPVTYPSPKRIAAQDENSAVYEGVKVGIKHEAIHRTENSADAQYIVDRPVVQEYYITLEPTDTMTVDELKENFARMCSLYFGADGSARIMDFIGGIVEIQED